MMRFADIEAAPHPRGNRIDLTWVHPDPDRYPGVRVVRRTATHPADPEDGTVVAEGTDLWVSVNERGEQVCRVVDEGLRGETMYYYTLFPYETNPLGDGVFDPLNRAAAMATAPYDMAGQMYEQLPAIYHRYDTDQAKGNPGELPAEVEGMGPLRRFLEVTGRHLDQLHSLTRTLLDLHDLDRVDGRLMPLLAQWIGWPTDYRLDVDAQRSELKKAPAIYKAIGIIPTVEATVKRIIGWESRVKEFAHNVLMTNQPERLNLWAQVRGVAGTWERPTEPLSLDAAYEGRPSAAWDDEDTLWLLYHTRRKASSETWFDEEGTAAAGEKGASVRRGQWDIWYKTYTEEEGWAPSQPLTNRNAIDRAPEVVFWRNELWVLWETYTEADQSWRISYRVRSGGAWSGVTPVSLWEDEVERRCPRAVVDDENRLWLFWEEKKEESWQLVYNRHNATGWELAEAQPFPSGADVEADLFLFSHPDDSGQPLWLFWARRRPAGGDQTRWEIAYRVKESLDPSAADWSAVRTLADSVVPDSVASDREPVVLLDETGHLEVFWSANRDRSWSLWRSTLDPATHDWAPADELTSNPYAQRASLPVRLSEGRTLLVYRSSERLVYEHEVYRATRTTDLRYSGSMTVDTRNVAKTALHGSYRDFQTYTYDTGVDGRRTDQNWYALDTAGIYLTPETEDPSLIVRNRNIVRRVLRQFMPAHTRAVFIIEPMPFREHVYTYDFPDVEPQRRIGEQAFESVLPETYTGVGDDYADAVPDWIWMHAWSEASADHHTVDFAADPIDTTHRTWHVGLTTEA